MIGGGIPWEWVVAGFIGGFLVCAVLTLVFNRPDRPGRLNLPRALWRRRNRGGET